MSISIQKLPIEEEDDDFIKRTNTGNDVITELNRLSMPFKNHSGET